MLVTPQENFFRWMAVRSDLVDALTARVPEEIFSADYQQRWRERQWLREGPAPSESDAVHFLKNQLLALLGREVGRAQKNGHNLNKIHSILGILEETQDTFARPPIEAYDVSVPQVREVIPTGIDPIDAQIGGLARGDLGIVALPSGRGKTALLINMAVAALFNGKTVLYLTVADQGRDELIPRIDSCILESPIPNQATARDLAERHRLALRQIVGKLWIADYTDRECSLEDVRRVVSTYASDLTIVDHADDVQSDWSDDPTVTRHSLRVVYTSLKKIAAQYNIPIWSASQTHEASWQMAALGIDGLAECKTGKASSTAVLLVFTGGHPEVPGVMYCTIAKARRSFSERVIPVRFDHSIHRIW